MAEEGGYVWDTDVVDELALGLGQTLGDGVVDGVIEAKLKLEALEAPAGGIGRWWDVGVAGGLEVAEHAGGDAEP